jgi:putative selenate reductase
LPAGKNVAVIGAGNSAMDAARAAKRIPGVENVTIIYRRTKRLMPADREELRLALEDGVVFQELRTPISYKNGILKCRKMTLGAPDESGRRSPVALEGQFDEIPADFVITAVGQQADERPLLENGIVLDKNGRVKTNPQTNETSVADVFVGGDLLRGPATVVEAIADGRKFAETVLEKEHITPTAYEWTGLIDKARQAHEIVGKKGVLERSCKGESGKCLECNAVCNLCVEVCPNRANVAVKVKGMTNANQVIHIDGMCNACGNCEAFCPYQSAPYMEKLTLYWNEEDFHAGENQGFWVTDVNLGSFKARIGNKTMDGRIDTSGSCEGLPEDIAAVIKAVLQEHRYII